MRPLPSICKTVLENLPHNLVGQDRVRYLADQVNALLDKDRTALREHMSILAERMLVLGASDLDAGGAACNGMIWDRVNGDKMPIQEIGTNSEDETDMLFLNLLTKKQLHVVVQADAFV